MPKKSLELKILDSIVPPDMVVLDISILYPKIIGYSSKEGIFNGAPEIAETLFLTYVKKNIEAIIQMAGKKDFNFNRLHSILLDRVYFYIKNQNI